MVSTYKNNKATPINFYAKNPIQENTRNINKLP